MPQSRISTILLTGATGFVGSHLRIALHAAGHTIRCATRSPEQARAKAPELTWVAADLMRPETLAPALAGCDAAIFLVHAMGTGTRTTTRSARRRAPRRSPPPPPAPA